MAAMGLNPSIAYQGQSGQGSWAGHHIGNDDAFQEFLRATVRKRLTDEESGFDDAISALASTGMASEFVARFLAAVPIAKGWEIGEALAECALREHCGCDIHFPWNLVRDRRTPRASLPGADLVGFLREDQRTLLMVGEVKTSSDPQSPPNVMYGGSGLTWQLEQSVTKLDIQHALVKWLHSRCREEPFTSYFKEAVGAYIESRGQTLVMIGFLVRDTAPDEKDLKNRIADLCAKLPSTRILGFAWYLPLPIDNWPSLMESGS